MKTFSIDVRLIFLEQISSRMKHPWKTNIIESSSSHTQVHTAANVFRCLLHRMTVQIQNIVLDNIEMIKFSKLKFALFEVVSSFPFQASLDFLWKPTGIPNKNRTWDGISIYCPHITIIDTYRCYSHTSSQNFGQYILVPLNPLFLWPCSIANCWSLPEGNIQ